MWDSLIQRGIDPWDESSRFQIGLLYKVDLTLDKQDVDLNDRDWKQWSADEKHK